MICIKHKKGMLYSDDGEQEQDVRGYTSKVQHSHDLVPNMANVLHNTIQGSMT